MRFTFPRESYIPRNSKPLHDTESDAVAYVYQTAGKFGAAMFYGKQAKPVWHWTFKKPEGLARAISEGFGARRRHAAYISSIRAERKEPHGLQVGDVFVTCWGYDQTNREHYEIVALHGATMATVRQIASHSVTTGWEQGKCSPDFGNFIGKPIRVKLSKSGFCVDGHLASKVAVTNIGGVKVGEASGWTSYA